MRAFKQPSVMSASVHQSNVPTTSPQRSTFDMSSRHITSFDAGLLIPIFLHEVLPGDTSSLSTNVVCRLTTPLKPIMDNLMMDMHFWFVPDRLCWKHWQEFMGERLNPNDDPNDFTFPKCTITLGDIQPASLAGYMGLPMIPGGGDTLVASLPFIAYCLVFNEWYRDENFQDSIDLDLEDATFPGPSGLDPHDASSLLPRGKRKDYFTGALPWPQKGDAVPLPIGGTAPIVIPGSGPMTGTGTATKINSAWGNLDMELGTELPVGTNFHPLGIFDTHPLGTSAFIQSTLEIDDPGDAYADLGSATVTTINAFRTAYQIQCLLERDARGGTRYIEILFSHFEVRSPDARLQRPEFLGGGTLDVVFNPIAQNSATGATGTPQANLAAIATVDGRVSFKHSFVEHGYIIGIASVRADLTYQSGIHRMWSRTTRYDFAWPSLAHIGEQAILNKEIYADGSAADDDVWGYQERYGEYRYGKSLVTGLMSSYATGTLDFWHLSQKFTSLPALNEDFIIEQPPVDRVIAVPSQPQFLADFYFKHYCTRVLPVYGVPGLTNVF